MTDQLGADLRQAFALRAAEVPTDAVERLRRVDYRLRTRRRWPLAVSCLGAASGTAAIVSVVVLGGPLTAFAGWSATPTNPTAVQTAATQSDCQASLSGALAQGSWSQVATDVRGPYTMVVYESGTSLASCLTGPSFTTVQAESLTAANGGMMVSASGAHPPTPASSAVRLLSGGDIEQLAVGHFAQAQNDPYTLVEGRPGPTVSAVTLVLSNGQDVTATTGSGWLVAWWPGGEDVTAARITSASGTTTDPLTPTPPPLPGNGPPGGATAVPVGSGTAVQAGGGGTAVPVSSGAAVPVGSGAGGTQSGTGGGASSGRRSRAGRLPVAARHLDKTAMPS